MTWTAQHAANRKAKARKKKNNKKYYQAKKEAMRLSSTSIAKPAPSLSFGSSTAGGMPLTPYPMIGNNFFNHPAGIPRPTPTGPTTVGLSTSLPAVGIAPSSSGAGFSAGTFNGFPTQTLWPHVAGPSAFPPGAGMAPAASSRPVAGIPASAGPPLAGVTSTASTFNGFPTQTGPHVTGPSAFPPGAGMAPAASSRPVAGIPASAGPPLDTGPPTAGKPPVAAPTPSSQPPPPVLTPVAPLPSSSTHRMTPAEMREYKKMEMKERLILSLTQNEMTEKEEHAKFNEKMFEVKAKEHEQQVKFQDSNTTYQEKMFETKAREHEQNAKFQDSNTTYQEKMFETKAREHEQNAKWHEKMNQNQANYHERFKDSLTLKREILLSIDDETPASDLALETNASPPAFSSPMAPRTIFDGDNQPTATASAVARAPAAPAPAPRGATTDHLRPDQRKPPPIYSTATGDPYLPDGDDADL